MPKYKYLKFLPEYRQMITYVGILASNPCDFMGWEARLESLLYLLYSELPLILYVDEFYRAKIQVPIPSNITILPFVPEETETFKMIAQYNDLKLGHSRNDLKDTHYYCSLMNTKIEMVMRAIDDGHVKTSHVGYIDAGIAKLFKNKQACFQRIKNVKAGAIQKIVYPGCWPPNILTVKIENMYENACWVFCGSLLFAPVEKMRLFHETCKPIFKEMLDRGYLLWEVNVWPVAVVKMPDEFLWYEGHHDDRMSMVPGT